MDTPKPGQVYRHYKGGLYKIICVAVEVAESNRSYKKMVVYQNIDPGVVYTDIDNPDKIWVRDVEFFTAQTEVNGVMTQRFTLVSDDSE